MRKEEKTAAKLLSRKGLIKAEAEKRLGKEVTETVWKEAQDRLAGILERYADLPSGACFHTYSFIFPGAAIYLALKEHTDAEKAYSIIRTVSLQKASEAGEKLARIIGKPGMRPVFFGFFSFLTKHLFGKNNGFQNVFYPKKKGEYRMDILACPYHRYMNELGCGELTEIFCDNDEYTYGKLPGVAFIRTGTLGKGCDRCDFCLRYTEKQQ